MPKHNERALRQKNAHADACATDQHYFVREDGGDWVCQIGTCTVRRPFGVSLPIELSVLQDEASKLALDLTAVEA